MPPRDHYIQAGVYVERIGVHENNVADLARRHGGRVRIPPGKPDEPGSRRGRPELVIPSEDGDLTIPAGGVAVLARGKLVDGYADPLEFEYDYAKVP